MTVISIAKKSYLLLRKIIDLLFFSLRKKNSSTHKYVDYNEYLNHQKEKTIDPERVKKWSTDEWQIKVDNFKTIFQRNIEYIENRHNAICLGSRTGQEVKALLDLGINAIGIDLVPFEPYTIEGDIHNLNFMDGKFDLSFTNIFDHSLYPEKFCSEMERIVSKNGIIIIHLLIGSQTDDYTETVIYNPQNVIKMFNFVEVMESRKIKNPSDSLNWELILKKI